jgi:hypothetical protein
VSENQEVDRLAPGTTEVKLTNGSIVQIQRLRTRQFFKLMKILTRGAGSMITEFGLSADMNPDEFMARLLALVTLSIPEAEDEALEFLRSMSEPVGLIEGRKLSVADEARNAEIWAGYDEVMVNPELDDLLDLIEVIVTTESEDIQRLAKRLASMFKVFQKTGQLDPTKTNTTTPSTTSATQPASLEASPEPSISSPPSTDGLTTES